MVKKSNALLFMENRYGIVKSFVYDVRGTNSIHKYNEGNEFLKKLKEKVVITKGGFITHISMGTWKGKYYINSDDNFMEDYCDVVERGDYHNECIGIAECSSGSGSYSPVRCDMDFSILEKNRNEYPDRLYSESDVMKLIEIYKQVFNEELINFKNDDFKCFYLTKDEPKEDGEMLKHGLHLHFPLVYVKNSVQKININKKVNDEIDKQNLFQFLKNGGGIGSDCFDDITNNAWLLFGSCKDDGRSYDLESIFDSDMNDVNLGTFIRRFDNILPNSDHNDEWYLPYILSISSMNRDIYESVDREEYVVPCQSVLIDYDDWDGNIDERDDGEVLDICGLDLETTTKNYGELLRLLPLLSDNRSVGFKEWSIIASVIRNSCTYEQGLELFLIYSKRCEEKYDEAESTLFYTKKRVSKMNIGIIVNMVKKDDPDGYERLKKIDSLSYCCKYVDDSHSDIATLVYKIYGKDDIIILDSEKGDMLIWNEDLRFWVRSTKSTFFGVVNKILKPIIGELIKKIKNRMGDPNITEDKLEALMERCDMMSKIEKKIKNEPYISCVRRWYMTFYKKSDKDNIEEQINRCPYQLPIKGGYLIDFKNKEKRLREKGDLFDFELKVDYKNDFDIDVITNYFMTLCCDDVELVDYLRGFLGYCMTGDISLRLLHIFFGDGLNGKSTLFNIMKKILGTYSISLSDDSMLKKDDGKRKGATPELMPLKEGRLGVLPESGKDAELNESTVKRITGGDPIVARPLFGQEVEFFTQVKVVLPTNNKPIINIDQQAVVDRIILVPFNARFDKEDIEQKNKIKNLINEKIDDFFSFFVTGAFDFYDGIPLKPSQSMIVETQEYLNELDVVGSFIKAHFVAVEQKDYDDAPKLKKGDLRVNRTFMYNQFIASFEGDECKISGKDFYKRISKIFIPKKVLGMNCYLCKVIVHDDEEK